MLRCGAHSFHHRIVSLAHAILRFELTGDHLAEVAAATAATGLWTDGLELLVCWDGYVVIDISVDLQ